MTKEGLIEVINRYMRNVLLVENRFENGVEYRPIKNTSRNDCYKTLYIIQELLIEHGRENEKNKN